MNYEEAKKKALTFKDNIDYCVESEDVYIFGADEERLNIGGAQPIVIIKETGEAMSNSVYMSRLTAQGIGFEVIREFKVE